MTADARARIRRTEEELLGRLGLDRGANPLAIETARDAIIGFLSTAPRGHGIYTIGGGNRTADPATMMAQIAIFAAAPGPNQMTKSGPSAKSGVDCAATR